MADGRHFEKRYMQYLCGRSIISQEWLKLELSIFFTKRDYIKSCQKDDKSPLKGAWFCSRD